MRVRVQLLSTTNQVIGLERLRDYFLQADTCEKRDKTSKRDIL
jgi:hypothetical protein